MDKRIHPDFVADIHKRLLSMSRGEHDDLSLAEDAADLINEMAGSIADLSLQIAEREAMLDAIEAALGHAGENVGERLVALETEVSRYQGELLEALRERDEARAKLAEAGR